MLKDFSPKDSKVLGLGLSAFFFSGASNKRLRGGGWIVEGGHSHDRDGFIVDSSFCFNSFDIFLSEWPLIIDDVFWSSSLIEIELQAGDDEVEVVVADLDIWFE